MNNIIFNKIYILIYIVQNFINWSGICPVTLAYTITKCTDHIKLSFFFHERFWCHLRFLDVYTIMKTCFLESSVVDLEHVVYLDNSATTVVCKEAADKILYVLTEKYGNPSSIHTMGFEAENEIADARCIVANKINCDEREVYFTSGGTEANNLAVFGSAEVKKRCGKKIVTTSIEHSSVLDSVKELERRGFEIALISPDKDGVFDVEKFFNAIDDTTIFVSAMMVNNEVGLKLPVENLKKIVKQKKSPAVIHVDAVQAFCKVPIDVKKMQIDLLSMSAHKIHGPKGVGALYVSKNVKIKPILFGGEQQNKIRPGTESVPLIAGFAQAVRLDSAYGYILELRDYCLERLKNIDEVVINSREDSVPYIVNFSVPGIKSETMLHFLASKNVFVSSGSACAKGKVSHVLKNMGFSKERIDSAIRLSFSRYNTKEDVDMFLNLLEQGIKTLARSRRNV